MSDRLDRAPVAVVGFGHQGAAQARMLRASGLDVIIGARADGPSEARARAEGFTTCPPAEAPRHAAVVAMLVPDEVMASVWASMRPVLHEGVACVFAHGFGLVYGDLDVSAAGDIVLVSPTGPGRLLGAAGPPLAAYLAVHRDHSGVAWDLAEAWARRLACEPRIRTTVREETEIDLFGEQVVLCGGMNALVRNAFEVLVARGYTPEVAYLECVHQLKYLADLLHERGVKGLRDSISQTALYGDLTRGSRVIGRPSHEAMETILDEIRSGAFAREWLAEVRDGAPRLAAAVAEAAAHPLEEARRRALSEPTADPA